MFSTRRVRFASEQQHPSDDTILMNFIVDLSAVSSVVSNVSASAPTTSSSADTVTQDAAPVSNMKITIHGYQEGNPEEMVLLQLYPQTHTLASEWLDGLLMLLNQQPITADTSKMVNLIGDYGLKIRLLNVRYEDLGTEEPVLPTREGLDEDYYYDIGGMDEQHHIAVES